MRATFHIKFSDRGLTPEDLASIAKATSVSQNAQGAGKHLAQVKLGLQLWKRKFGYQAIRKWILAILVFMQMEDHTYILEHGYE